MIRSLCVHAVCRSCDVLSCAAISYVGIHFTLAEPEFLFFGEQNGEETKGLNLYPRIDNLMEQGGDLRNLLTATASSDRR